jgi:hypothetical protein
MIMSIRHWFYFQSSDLDFKYLSYKKKTILPELLSLNERRKAIQKEILFLSSESDTCKNCPTSCCRGNYNHFTIVDYIIRMFSDKPIKEFGKNQLKPPSLYYMVYERIIKPRSVKTVSEPVSESALKCPNLTVNGCAFPAEDRPIRCVLYTCRAFRNSLSNKSFRKTAILTKELSTISASAFKVFTR